ncbi:MAG: PIG-L family deacetylase [Methanosarcina sp.]|uniref:PIG-L deacetylase family protein n=1 Tax=Methanosarcina sp. TaxID=2213 RepID=UPI0026141857|nr:PIG-L family deacetylase [Methanosarcina sp.]MDD3245966.1 PIG-L family deacetylase [Methanosarcina sp.]MDD4247604.1 PIG-L family deacetylase [Methanosarcina sp.]
MDANIKTILISPHSDDIAYSLGGSLLKNHFEKPVISVTVFTKSNFSPRLKLTDPEEITRTRYLEDIEFTKKIGIEYKSFQFPEPPLRGRTSHKEISKSDPYLDPIYNEVYLSLSELIKSYPNALVVSPMSLGDNIDHRIVFESCVSICKENNRKITFYEDVPYVSLLTLKQVKNKAFEINANLKPSKIDITSTFYEKLKNLKLYKTQIGRKVPKGVLTHAARLGIKNENFIEFVWKNKLLKYFIYYYLYIGNKSKYERIWR